MYHDTGSGVALLREDIIRADSHIPSTSRLLSLKSCSQIPECLSFFTMALAIGIDQKSLHDCSKASLNSLKQERPEKVYPTAKSKAEEPIIPWPSIFQSLTDMPRNVESTILPTITECAVHLELLQCFHKLRVEVLKSTSLDKTFGIVANPQIFVRKQRWGPDKTIKKRDPTFETRRKQKWPLFLDLAVVRFDRWFRLADIALTNPREREALNSIIPPLGKFCMSV